MRRLALFVMVLLLCGSSQATQATEHAAPSQADTRLTIERYRAQKLALAEPMKLIGVYYAANDTVSSTLFLANKIADPVQVDLYVHRDDGEVQSLGRHFLEPNRHLELPLEKALGVFSSRFESGSLSVEFLGDADTLQGWLVLRRGDDVFEIPLMSPSTTLGNHLTSFWDLRPLRDSREVAPVFHFLHVGTQPIRASILNRQTGKIVDRKTIELSPGQRFTLRPDSPAGSPLFGSLEVVHDGEAGSLLGTAILEGKGRTWARLPMLELEDQGLDKTYYSLRSQAGWVTLYNPNEKPLSVELDTLDWRSGDLEGSQRVTLGPRSIRTVPLAETGKEFRLRARGDHPFAVSGWGQAPNAVMTEQAWFPPRAAHPNGSYPLPSLDSHRASHEVLNLGDSELQMVGQIDWDGGSYTFGPIDIPPGGAHELDFGALAELGEPDVAGRLLDPEYRDGFFRWTSQGESRLVVGRLQVAARNGEENFGFNCTQCCPEMPFGTVVPGFVEFTPGQTPSLQSCVSYSTCNGTMGPFATTPSTITAPSPFTWDGIRIGASTAADGDVSFEAMAQGTDLVCFSFWSLIFGEARAEMCQETFNPMEYDPGEVCTSQTSSCLFCNACCENIYQERLCQGKNVDIITSERNVCLGHCITVFQCEQQ